MNHSFIVTIDGGTHVIETSNAVGIQLMFLFIYGLSDKSVGMIPAAIHKWEIVAMHVSDVT